MNGDRLSEEVLYAMGDIQEEYILAAHKNTYESQGRKTRHIPLKRKTLILAATLVLLIGMSVTAFAEGIFSAINEDELGLSSVYEGNGIVSISVRNDSDKELIFEPKLKLMKFQGSIEVEQSSAEIVFSKTIFAAHSEGLMTIDLSQAYDITTLEKPLEANDNYYLVLTNAAFIFGHDWICTVDFNTNEQSKEEIKSQGKSETNGKADAKDNNRGTESQIIAGVEVSLQPFFDSSKNSDEKINNIGKYFEICSEILSKKGIEYVKPVEPIITMKPIKEGDTDIILDKNVAAELQYQLITCQIHNLDEQNIPIGASASEAVYTLGTCIPQNVADKTDTGGAGITLLYLYTYEKSQIQDINDYAFIHGKIVTFGELEDCKVYEDEKYVCYDATDYFFTDVDSQISIIQAQRTDIYCDKDVKTRVHNVYRLVHDKERLSEAIRILS